MKCNVEVLSIPCVVAQNNLAETVQEAENENSTLLLQLDSHVVLVSSHKVCETFGSHQPEITF